MPPSPRATSSTVQLAQLQCLRVGKGGAPREALSRWGRVGGTTASAPARLGLHPLHGLAALGGLMVHEDDEPDDEVDGEGDGVDDEIPDNVHARRVRVLEAVPQAAVGEDDDDDGEEGGEGKADKGKKT